MEGFPEFSLLQMHKTRRAALIDIAIIMETLEHMHSPLIMPYFEKISKHTKHCIFITILKEIGILLLLKCIVKNTFSLGMDGYTLQELLNSILGEQISWRGTIIRVSMETTFERFKGNN